jgi:hypothetical protein
MPAADVTLPMLALPGVAVVQLARAAWHEPGSEWAELGSGWAGPGSGWAGHGSGWAGPAIGALVALIVMATPVAVRAVRWDPRR